MIKLLYVYAIRLYNHKIEINRYYSVTSCNWLADNLK